MSNKIKGSNPMFNNSVYEKSTVESNQNAMTLNGTVLKTIALFALLVGGALFSWTSSITETINYVLYAALLVGAFVLSLITTFVPKASPFTAPVYAVLEGMLLGIISKIFSDVFSGIVFKALLLTGGIFCIALIFYVTGLIKVTQRFRMTVITATCGIVIALLIDSVTSLFGMSLGILFGGGIWGIAISLFIVIIASLNFLLDFDFIDKMRFSGAPKYMEWYSGFGLMLTFVWLYLEVLRLLSKISSR